MGINFFKQSLKVVMIATAFVITTQSQAFANENQVYIKLGEAKARKSLIAIPKFKMPSTSSAVTDAHQKVYSTLVNNLTVSALFDIVPETSFLEDINKKGLKPAPLDPNGFSFASWKQIGAEFLVRADLVIRNKEINSEFYLYHINRGVVIMGKKYKAPESAARQLAHTISNDVVKALTGSESMYLSKFVFASDRDGGNFREIYSMDWDGANLEKVTNHKSIALSPNWSPDGKKIAYTAYVKRTGNPFRNADMYIYDVVSGKRSLVSFRKGLNSGACFAEDGKSLYLTISESGNPDIYQINSTSGDVIKRLTRGPNGAMNVEPAISPDGSKVAFSSDRSGKPMIYIMNSDGTNAKRITFAGVYNATPTWSADGSKIAFAGQSDGNFDIFVVNADGTNLIRLTTATKSNGKRAHNEDPSFSPDGRFVVYTSNRTGKNQIFISTADGSEERRVTNDNNNYYKPKWSKNIQE